MPFPFLSKLLISIVELSEFINPPTILINNKFPKNKDPTIAGRDININSRIN